MAVNLRNLGKSETWHKEFDRIRSRLLMQEIRIGRRVNNRRPQQPSFKDQKGKNILILRFWTTLYSPIILK